MHSNEERRAAQVEIAANGRKVPKQITKVDAKLKDAAELPVADRTWTHPQLGVKSVCEYRCGRLDREGVLAVVSGFRGTNWKVELECTRAGWIRFCFAD
ncbi:hypothetical protein HMPREF3145_04730 [Corynebacterium sp. HMSC05C01]|nr:hypothetical protein HMPREF2785_00145 [Corynebacterium sp. HMSC067D03]OFT70618.1 hypothetical protein HMPREF3145_04730 [Corynebacterium sp. HMSC05C01]